MAARTAAIEQSAGQPAAALAADVRGSAEGFIAAADRMPAIPALGVSRAGGTADRWARWLQIPGPGR
jgi:hypothetical protein